MPYYREEDVDIRISRGRDPAPSIPYRRPGGESPPLRAGYRYGTTAYLAPEIGAIRRSASTGQRRERSPVPPPPPAAPVAAPAVAPIVINNQRVYNDYSDSDDSDSLYDRSHHRLSVGGGRGRRHRSHSRHVSISHSPSSGRTSFSRDDLELERTRNELERYRAEGEREREREKMERQLRERERLLREEERAKGELERYRSEKEKERTERLLREEFELLTLREEKKRMERDRRTAEEKERADKEIRDTYERMKRMEQERLAREKKEREEAIEKFKREEAERAAREKAERDEAIAKFKREEEAKAAKERKEREEIIENFKKQEAARLAKEKAEKDAREKEYQRRLHEDLHKAGLDERTIVAISKGELPKPAMPPAPMHQHQHQHPHPPPPPPMTPRPTYTRMSRRHLSIETLRVYGIQYEFDKEVRTSPSHSHIPSLDHPSPLKYPTNIQTTGPRFHPYQALGARRRARRPLGTYPPTPRDTPGYRAPACSADPDHRIRKGIRRRGRQEEETSSS
jgi:hypothetical protein